MENASKIAGRIVTIVCVSAFCAALTVMPPRAAASSHREAPLITEMPKVDGTDWYMFRSYESGRADFVTMVANYYPLQDPFGGPNYFLLDPNARYEMTIDNVGDAKADGLPRSRIPDCGATCATRIAEFAELLCTIRPEL